MRSGFWILFFGCAVSIVGEALNRFLPFRLRRLRRNCRFYGVLGGTFIQFVAWVVLLLQWTVWR